MEDKQQYLEEMKELFQELSQQAEQREKSIHTAASYLFLSEGCFFGLGVIAYNFFSIKRSDTLMDKVFLIAAAGTLFASMILAALAQWHPSRDAISDADLIQVQMQETPEVFAAKEQRLQYSLELYEKSTSDLQRTNAMLNQRLRASAITFLSGTGIFLLTICLMLFVL